MRKETEEKTTEIIPLFGRDEMNLVEFPFGPITTTSTKTYEVEHEAFDRQLKRYVARRLLITGSDAFGLPRPIDDQVLVGMKALTYEAGFSSRRVHFSRYQLCKAIGWQVSGRSYERLEESLDRIAGTTLKFKDAWWDKGEQEWKTKTFHLIETVELCSRDRFDRARLKSKQKNHQLCCFVWSEEVWKSFADGNIKSLDMEMFRRISRGKRREVPLRLYRVLDKRLYKRQIARFDLRKLCIGTLGLSASYCPSEMSRILERAAKWLLDCSYITDFSIRRSKKSGTLEAVFWRTRGINPVARESSDQPATESRVLNRFFSLPKEKRERLLELALMYAKQEAPSLLTGYRRNEAVEGETKRKYLEMLLRAYLTRKSRVAA